MKEDETNDGGNKPRNNSTAWRTIAGRSKPGTIAGAGTTPGTTPGTIINGGPDGSSAGSQEGGSPVIKRSHHGPNERAGGRKKSGVGSQPSAGGSRELENGTNPSSGGTRTTAGSTNGTTAGSVNGTTAGDSSQEKDQAFLEFPQEAYFADGRLKKSWAEKLSGGKVKDAKPVTTLKKKAGKSFIDDKELLEQVVEGIQTGFKGLDLLADYGLGVIDVWTLEEAEAEVLARVLLRRADKGDKAALKTIQTMRDNGDLLQAAMVVIPRLGITVKEVARNGAKPHIKKRTSDPIPGDGDKNNPGN